MITVLYPDFPLTDKESTDTCGTVHVGLVCMTVVVSLQSIGYIVYSMRYSTVSNRDQVRGISATSNVQQVQYNKVSSVA